VVGLSARKPVISGAGQARLGHEAAQSGVKSMVKTTPKLPETTRQKPTEAVISNDSEKPIIVSRKVFSDFAMI